MLGVSVGGVVVVVLGCLWWSRDETPRHAHEFKIIFVVTHDSAFNFPPR